MEFEDVNQMIEWECKRIATAFGVREWSEEVTADASRYREFFGSVGILFIGWGFYAKTGNLEYISAETKNALSMVSSDASNDQWTIEGVPDYNQVLARGLYRLGFTDQQILSQLPPLSAHEKLELRLSLPREFWPKKWLDEEGMM